MIWNWIGPAILAWAGRCTIKCTLIVKNDGGNIVSRRLKISAILGYSLSMSLVSITGEYNFFEEVA
jgi:hypothetical protein